MIVSCQPAASIACHAGLFRRSFSEDGSVPKAVKSLAHHFHKYLRFFWNIQQLPDKTTLPDDFP
jgi:hypothetical protein